MDSFMGENPRTTIANHSDFGSQRSSRGAEFDLREFFRKLWRRKSVIAATVALLTVAAVIVLFQIPPRYQSYAQVLIESRNSSMINIEELVGGRGVDTETIESEMEVIKSRRLAEKVIDQLRLSEDLEFNPALRPQGFFDSVFDVRSYFPTEWAAALFGGHSSKPLTEDEIQARERVVVVDEFLSRLTVARQGFSRVISIGFSSEDPNRAAEIANKVAADYIIDQLEAKFEATSRTTAWLNDKIAGLREKVDASERAVEAYRKEAGLLQGTEGPLITQQISDLNAQLILAEAHRAEAEARLGQVQRLIRSAGGAGSAADVLDSPIVQALMEKETEIRRKVVESSGQFGDKHPKMISARAELNDIQSKIESEVNKVVQTLKNEVGIARARESTLRDSLEHLKLRLGQSNTAEVRLRALKREADADKALLETFLARFEQKSTEQDMQSQRPDARVISMAEVPTDPSFPKKTIILALVVVASTILGVLLVFLLEQLDKGFRSGDQIERLTGTSVLSLVPSLTGAAKKRQTPPDYILDRPMSAYGEAVRGLYTSLLLSHVDAPPKTVVFTSAQSGEGKTTLALSLTRMLAKSGRRVILIDTDLRKPSVSTFLGIPTGPGLVELLAGEAKLEDVTRVDQPSGAHLITAGKFAPNAADIVASDHMKRLLQGLAQSYDLVILDSPPVLAVSDARILATIVDRVVFTVRWADTRRETVVMALKQLVASGASLAGVVLNVVNVKKHAQYGYGDSGYYTGRIKKYYVD